MMRRDNKDVEKYLRLRLLHAFNGVAVLLGLLAFLFLKDVMDIGGACLVSLGLAAGLFLVVLGIQRMLRDMWNL
jgi:hypothetical protein